MPNLTSMKRSESEMAKPYGLEMEDREYPWGLKVHLEDEDLEKLGIDMLPDVGGKRLMIARVEIVSASRHDTQDGVDRSMSLQITDMKLREDEPERDPADVMYGNKEGGE